MMQLKFMASTYKWSDDKFKEQLLFSLRGEALLYVANLSQDVRDNSSLLVKSLEQRFGHCLLAETHRANLYNLRKSSKETIQQYSARVSQLMSRSYPGMEGTTIYNNLAIEHLLKGLPDQKLAYEVLTRKPKDLAEAVDMITWHEACRQYTMKSSTVRHLENHDISDNESENETEAGLRRVDGRKIGKQEKVSQLWQEMQNYIQKQLTKIVSLDPDFKQQTNNTSGDQRSRDIVCYSCNEPGHIAPACPHRQKQKDSKKKAESSGSEN